MQIRHPLRTMQLQVISQKLIKFQSLKNVYPMVFFDKVYNKIYTIKIIKTYWPKICKLDNKK